MHPESNKVEYKEKLNENFEKEVVGFLNYKEGGTIFVGVDDNCNPKGVKNIDEVQLQISDRIKKNIFPITLGLFDIEIIEQNKKRNN